VVLSNDAAGRLIYRREQRTCLAGICGADGLAVSPPRETWRVYGTVLLFTVALWGCFASGLLCA
jgi:hypothetical protein